VDLTSLFGDPEAARRLQLYLSSRTRPSDTVPMRGTTGCSDRLGSGVYETPREVDMLGGWLLHAEAPTLGLHREVVLQTGRSLS
jgi:hypothetical protein